ncbi:MAG: polyamine aminopropyltransferase [Clostridiales bacterium]|nr:polyamine aminopropyltransferase [Clostridiales bacterium]
MEMWYTEVHTDEVKWSIKVNKTIYTDQSVFQKIDIFETNEFGKVMTLDGLMMVNEKDEFIYHDMIVHVSMATNPNIKRVLVIGGGDGGTVRELTRYETIEKIDMVEIDELVVKASIKYLDYTANKLSDERVNLFYEDGIEFVKGLKNEYDLIIVDSTDPIGPGEGLFTTEFYTNCFNALSGDGILVNQKESPYYAHNAREMKRSHDKLKEIFPLHMTYQYHMPSYPSGHWLFGFSSKGLNPIEDLNKDAWNALGLKTKYYNTDLHVGAFMIPNYVKELLNEK